MSFEYAAMIVEMTINIQMTTLQQPYSCQYHVDARFKGIKPLFYPKCLVMLRYIACHDIASAAKLH